MSRKNVRMEEEGRRKKEGGKVCLYPEPLPHSNVLQNVRVRLKGNYRGRDSFIEW
jgi:hypothetical protein